MDKIKLLFLHRQLVCGGAEQALYDLICLLDKNVFDVSVLCLCEGGEWEQKFRDAGIRVESRWSCQRKSHNPIVKIDNWVKRRKIVKATKAGGKGLIEAGWGNTFDIVICYHVDNDEMEACFCNDVKTIKYIHGDLNTNQLAKKHVVDRLKIINRFDKVICVSANAKKSFEQVTGISENVKVHFNPLNSDNVKELAEQGEVLETSEPVIVAVGRLAPEKGFERLIRIHKKIYDEGNHHKLVIVGDGPMRELLGNIINSIHCEESVALVGYTSNPYAYMKQSRFIVCSSYTEGLPVIAMEALSLGVPVVSSVPSIAEIFGDEKCGIVTQDNDDASLENAIRQMLTNREFYESAKKGAERRSAFFEGKRMVREIEEELIELVKNKN